ncbi:hypothetical protein TUM12370_16930 [Salmonella enterica subsp. enterica serovar Choleraesuis]|nr:hypothetical protein TUM12370_16930 [Salmonella enterica subsp. enterica serovar Choleraesuis]
METTPQKIARALNENYPLLQQMLGQIKDGLYEHCKNTLYTHLLEVKFDDDDLVITFPLLGKQLISSQRFAFDKHLMPAILLRFDDEADNLISSITLSTTGSVGFSEETEQESLNYDDPRLAAVILDNLMVSLCQQQLINC